MSDPQVIVIPGDDGAAEEAREMAEVAAAQATEASMVAADAAGVAQDAAATAEATAEQLEREQLARERDEARMRVAELEAAAAAALVVEEVAEAAPPVHDIRPADDGQADGAGFVEPPPVESKKPAKKADDDQPEGRKFGSDIWFGKR